MSLPKSRVDSLRPGRLNGLIVNASSATKGAVSARARLGCSFSTARCITPSVLPSRWKTRCLRVVAGCCSSPSCSQRTEHLDVRQHDSGCRATYRAPVPDWITRVPASFRSGQIAPI